VTPTHHLPDDVLTAYAAGSLSEGVALWVATHLALCPTCREQVALADAVGGALIETIPEAPVADGLLDALLDRLDDDDRGTPPAPPSPTTDAVIPEPLRSYTGPFSDLTWTRRGPIISTSAISVQHGKMPVRLFRLRPGVQIPPHTHDGLERGLVLTGGFTDDEGHFVRGDVSIRDGSRDHLATIDKGEPCVMLFVNDAPLVPRTVATRLASLWVEL